MTAAADTSGAASKPAQDPLDYFNRAIPEPYRILGLRMLPLSIGRYRLLKRFDVAFVCEGRAMAGIPDLLLGVLICSMRVDDFLRFSTDPDFEKQIRKWSNRVFPHAWMCSIPWIGKKWRAKHGFNVLEKMGLFQRFIEESQKIPHYSSRTNSPSNNSGHWSHSIEICLRSELGWTIEEINESPLSKALSDYLRHAEANGHVILMTDEDLKIGDANAAIIEAALRDYKPEEESN